MTLRPFLLVTMLSALASSCAPEFDVPPAPDVQPVLDAYENPTAIVGSEIMSAVADEIAEAAKQIEDSEVFEEILQVIIDVQEELEDATNEDGDLVLGATCEGGANEGGTCASDSDCPESRCGGGVVYPSPTGAIRIAYICPGWDDDQFNPDYEAEPDPAYGTLDLFMTLDKGGIGRLVWGSAHNCLYLVPGGDRNFEASYDGGVAVDLGGPVPPGEDITQLLVTFIMEGNIGFDGGDFRVNQSFRAVLAADAGLEILVDVGDPALSETFNYIFLGTRQAVQDATGSFGCSLEESRCFDESGTLFSW